MLHRWNSTDLYNMMISGHRSCIRPLGSWIHKEFHVSTARRDTGFVGLKSGALPFLAFPPFTEKVTRSLPGPLMRDIVQDDNEDVADKLNFWPEHLAWPLLLSVSNRYLYNFRIIFALISLPRPPRAIPSSQTAVKRSLSNILIVTRYIKSSTGSCDGRSSRVKRRCVGLVWKRGRNASRIKSDCGLVYDSRNRLLNVALGPTVDYYIAKKEKKEERTAIRYDRLQSIGA